MLTGRRKEHALRRRLAHTKQAEMDNNEFQLSDRERLCNPVIEQSLRLAVGSPNVMTGEAISEWGSGWSDLGAPLALVRPASTIEVANVASICSEAGIAMVAWGGRTGLVDGACAHAAVAISLDRMDAVEELDKVDGLMLVQAGCVIQSAYEAAEGAGMFFPLDLGSRGSATVGGAIATNAGGNRVVHFGMMRQQVLGIEAVLADGTVLSSLNPLIKNNTGYDLAQLFCGSEGTLGIVTRAVVRLRPTLPGRNVALLGFDSFMTVASLLRTLESQLGGQLSAFEVMWPRYYELVTTPPAKGRPILPAGHGYYVLVEAMGGDPEGDAQRFETALASAMEAHLFADAVIAKSEAEAAAIWALRDDGEQVGRIGPYLAFDVSLRLSRIEAFASELVQALEARWPGKESVVFGHVGDGNIHLVIAAASEDTAHRAEVTGAVLDLVGKFEGSISAEHGIGFDKRDYLHLSRSREEIEAMRRIKQALDPRNLMNPGKVLPPVEPTRTPT